jgi:hypothetical protein
MTGCCVHGLEPDTTAGMSLGELMLWHELAIARNQPEK